MQCEKILILITCITFQLIFKSEILYFAPGSIVSDKGEPADRLMIVSQGTVDLFIYSCELTFQKVLFVLEIIHPPCSMIRLAQLMLTCSSLISWHVGVN